MYPHLDEHPAWPMVLPFLTLTRNGRESGRPWLEVVGAGAWLRQTLQTVEVACANCGRRIHPIRARFGDPPTGALYVTVSCEQDATFSCSRTGRAHAEIERLVVAITGAPPVLPSQPRLFA